jgi:hypothetical protein
MAGATWFRCSATTTARTGRNIDSSPPGYTKERFVPSQCSLNNAVLGQFERSLSTCNAEKVVDF